MKQILRPLGVAATLAVAAFLFAGTAQAQITGPTATCNSGQNQFFGTGFNDVVVYSIPPASGGSSSQVRALDTPIAAGTYDLYTVGWDGGATRATLPNPQLFEHYFVQLLDAGGSVLATSNSTGADLEDNVEVAEWAGSLGQVSWTGADATQVRIVHTYAGIQGNYQSIHARCIGWDPASVQTSTTTTTTTTTTTSTSSSTSTTTTTSTPDPGGATTSTTTTTTTQPTTTSTPTEVLPEVEVAQPADPQPGDPSFTG